MSIVERLRNTFIPPSKLLKSIADRLDTMELKVYQGHELVQATKAELLASNSLATAELSRVESRQIELVGAIEKISNQIESLATELRATRLSADDHLCLGRISEERSRTIEHICSEISARLVSQTSLASKAETSTLSLIKVVEPSILTLEKNSHKEANVIMAAIGVVIDNTSATLALTRVSEERSRTLQFICEQNSDSLAYQIELEHKKYIQQSIRTNAGVERSPLETRVIPVLSTRFPFAVSSNDYLHPESTIEGVVRPTEFVLNCLSILGADMSVLDLGVGAGGLVYEFVMNGVLAVGLDGSDFCAKYKLGYWPLLKHNLLNCDVTKPFRLFLPSTNDPHKFDLITMWEVLEHIDEVSLAGIFENVLHHLGDDGYFVGSISCIEYADIHGHPYHVTLYPRAWWKETFAKNGLTICEEHPFEPRFFCRGVGRRYHDFHNYTSNPDAGFHFVARRNSTS
jgi:2-polyprenyl-3-methyl-5-hydroxy-6-metoxy-1,4-benzoquinol methylase